MARVIHKHQLRNHGKTVVLLHRGSQWLDIQYQRGQLTMWVAANTEGELFENEFAVYPTGATVEPEFDAHLRTVQDEASFVWHIFMKAGIYNQQPKEQPYA
jgi:hypothetical protein